jgi:hypothetical protein
MHYICERLPDAARLSFRIFHKVPKRLWRVAARLLKREIDVGRLVLFHLDKSEAFIQVGQRLKSLHPEWRQLFNPNRLNDISANLWVREQDFDLLLRSLAPTRPEPPNDPEPSVKWVSAAELITQKRPRLGNGKKATPPKRKIRNPHATCILPAMVFITLRAIGLEDKATSDRIGTKRTTYRRIAMGEADEIGLTDNPASNLVEMVAEKKRELDKILACLKRFGLVPG